MERRRPQSEAIVTIRALRVVGFRSSLSAPDHGQFTRPVDRGYRSLVVYYLYTLRVCSGPQQTRYIVQSYVAAAENLTRVNPKQPLTPEEQQI